MTQQLSLCGLILVIFANPHGQLPPWSKKRVVSDPYWLKLNGRATSSLFIWPKQQFRSTLNPQYIVQFWTLNQILKVSKLNTLSFQSKLFYGYWSVSNNWTALKPSGKIVMNCLVGNNAMDNTPNYVYCFRNLTYGRKKGLNVFDLRNA